MKNLFRARAFLALLLLLPVWLPAIALAAQSPARPNLLVIMADDLGYGDLSSYGAADLRTPHIDRLVQEGMRFDFFRANSAVCSPTRASFLTGRPPELAGVPGVIRTHADNSWGYLSPNLTTLPQALQSAGYTSALIGKWHLGLESPGTPNERGFDFFHGFLGDMMDDYYNHRRHGINYMRRNLEVLEPQGHATDLFTDWACDYLRRQAGGGQPFFLFLSYNAPHTPIQPPPESLQKVLERESGISEKRAKLVALVEHMDDGIGRVLETLKQQGLEQNTLVIFTSDNGGDLPAGGLNGALRAGKGTMYEGGLRVPFAARWPGQIKPGTRSEAAGLIMDIFPTLLEAAGTKPPQPIEGVTLLPVLLGKTGSLPERDLFFIRREGGNGFGGKTIDALIRGDWKLLQNTPFTPLELYNLKNDPLEQQNLAAKEKKVFNELSAALRRQIQRGGAVPWQRPGE
jgi:arylsulfatase A-like enzyme